jgi:hypothetical protein
VGRPVPGHGERTAGRVHPGPSGAAGRARGEDIAGPCRHSRRGSGRWSCAPACSTSWSRAPCRNRGPTRS